MAAATGVVLYCVNPGAAILRPSITILLLEKHEHFPHHSPRCAAYA